MRKLARINKEETFEVIDWLRFPLVLLVVYIHSVGDEIKYDSIDFSHLSSFDLYNLLKVGISNVLAHIAVPIFFFISGFLFFRNIKEWDYSIYILKLKKRIKSLFLPFILWNSIAIFLILQGLIRTHGLDSAIDFLGDNHYLRLYWDCNMWEDYRCNWLGISTPMYGPYLPPLWYLRDLMVMSLFVPCFYCLFKYTKFWGLVILFFCYISGVGLNCPGFHTTSVFFFGAGAYISIKKIDFIKWLWRFRFVIIPIQVLLLFITIRFLGYHTRIGEFIYPFFVIMGSATAFCIATFFVKKALLIPHIFSESSFFIYLSHYILVTSFSTSLMKVLLGTSNPLLMSIGYLLSPFISVTICMLVYLFLRRITPSICSILVGFR